MVARTPQKQLRKMVVVPPHVSPTLLRETVKKVDKCMARLQELQYTVTGGTKVISGVNSSPRSSRNSFRGSLRCKQESLRIRNGNNSRRSPPGKLPAMNADDWRRMSLPAMLLGETMGELLQATQFARNIVQAAASSLSSKTRKPATTDDPKTPTTDSRNPKTNVENSGLMQARRRREKQVVLQTIRSESDMPSPSSSSLTRAKSKINFKASREECDKENCRYIANRVSPRNRPWARKTVLFPNPLFHSSSPTSRHQKLSKTTKSPVVARSNNNPHKFLIKSPPPYSSSKFQVKIKSPPISISPTKKSPKAASSSAAAKMRRSFSPSRLANKLVSPLKSRKSSVQKNQEMKFAEVARNRETAFKFLIKSSPRGKIKTSSVSTSSTRTTTSFGKKMSPKLRRSFSPSRLANRIVMSPLKIRNSTHKN